MSYATLADMVAAFGEDELLALADRDDDGVADADVIASAQQRAQSLIDGYFGGRYALPLVVPYTTVLVGAAADIQRYFLYDNEAPDRVKELFDLALTWLKDVAAGRVVLALPPPPEAPGGYAGRAGYSAPDRVWSDAVLAGF